MKMIRRFVAMLLLAAPWPFAQAVDAASDVEGVAIALDSKTLTLRLSNGEERKLDRPASVGDLRPGSLVKAGKAVDGKSAAALEVIGATVVGVVGEIAADESSLIAVVRRPSGEPPSEWTAKSVEDLKHADGALTSLAVNVGSTELRPRVKGVHVGDRLVVVYRQDGEPGKQTLAARSIDWQADAPSRGTRWGSLLAAAIALFIVALLFTRGHPDQLFLGTDNRYSASKFQTVLWFWAVISAYLAIVAQRASAGGMGYLGGVEIPQNLLVLSGISVLTLATSKAITSGKVDAANVAGDTNPKQTADAPSWADLISKDNPPGSPGRTADLGQFQMLVITGIAVGMFVMSVAEFMALIELRRSVVMPDVDTALAALFGLGQGGYLAKKAASPVRDTT